MGKIVASGVLVLVLVVSSHHFVGADSCASGFKKGSDGGCVECQDEDWLPAQPTTPGQAFAIFTAVDGRCLRWGGSTPAEPTEVFFDVCSPGEEPTWVANEDGSLNPSGHPNRCLTLEQGATPPARLEACSSEDVRQLGLVNRADAVPLTVGFDDRFFRGIGLTDALMLGKEQGQVRLRQEVDGQNTLWNFDMDGRIRTSTNHCLQVNTGRQIEVGPCAGVARDVEKWKIDRGFLYSSYFNLVVGMSDSGLAELAPIVDENFKSTPSLLSSKVMLQGKCVEIGALGDPVLLRECDGSDRQTLVTRTSRQYFGNNGQYNEYSAISDSTKTECLAFENDIMITVPCTSTTTFFHRWDSARGCEPCLSRNGRFETYGRNIDRIYSGRDSVAQLWKGQFYRKFFLPQLQQPRLPGFTVGLQLSQLVLVPASKSGKSAPALQPKTNFAFQAWLLASSPSLNTCHRCPLGQQYKDGVCIPCPSGHHCVSKAQQPVSCPKGFLCREGLGPFACPPGFLCTPTSTKEQSCPKWNLCPDGKQAFSCPDTKHCPPNAHIPQDCPDGYYCAGGRIQTCPAGLYCEDGGLLVCPSGSYCPGGVQKPIPCEGAGVFCGIGSVAPGLCPAGSYCPYPSRKVVCEKGFYCPEGSQEQQPCVEKGTYCGPESSSPQSCTAGFYCPDTRTKVACEAGFYCPEGSQEQQPCVEKGTYCGPESSSPQSCTAGFYCPNTSTKIECKAGFYCPQGSDSQLPCTEQGTFCGNGSPSPQVCPGGSFCPTTSDKKSCEKGYYCPESSVTMTLCPPGRCCPNTFMQSPDACPGGFFCEEKCSNPIQCPQASFCAVNSTSPTSCPGGSFCPEGSTLPKICPAASFCPPKSGTPKPCEAGFFCEQGSEAGTECPAAFFCPAASASPQVCPAANYCPPKSGEPKPCEAGFFCEQGSEAGTECPAAFFCPAASASPRDCPGGSYCPALSSKPTDCPELHFCPPKRAEPTPCPAGYICVNPKMEFPVECSAGFYCPAQALKAEACPKGQYCPPVSAYPGPCPQGTYCPAAITQPLVCTVGHYCPTNSSQPVECEINEFQDIPGQATCKSCRPGEYQPSRGKTFCIACTQETVKDPLFKEQCKTLAPTLAPTMAPTGRTQAPSQTPSQAVEENNDSTTVIAVGIAGFVTLVLGAVFFYKRRSRPMEGKSLVAHQGRPHSVESDNPIQAKAEP